MKKVMFAALAGMILSLLTAMILQNGFLYLLGCAIITFSCFAIDKYSAVRESERLPERFLLLLALAGGALSACLAMLCFRHKTRKTVFCLPVAITALIQTFILLVTL